MNDTLTLFALQEADGSWHLKTVVAGKGPRTVQYWRIPSIFPKPKQARFPDRDTAERALAAYKAGKIEVRA